MSAVPQTRFIEALAAIVGAANVLTEAGDMAPYLVDWRKQFSGPADCVVRPANTAEVAAVVAQCARAGVAIVPQGGNTGLCGASVPGGRQREIVLSLTRMNRIRAIDPLNDTLIAEAGCVLADIQRAAREADRFFPLSLGAEGSCRIGGNLSTNAGGVNVLRFGNARDQVLGLEVVLPDGRVWDGLRGLRKDNTGYDLKQLFIGAEGTLGIITAAVLKLYPQPLSSATAWFGLATPRQAIELLALLRARLGDRLTAFELLARVCIDAALAHIPGIVDPLPAPHPWYVLVELGDSDPEPVLRQRAEQAFAESLERGVARDVVLAQSGAQSQALWAIRERMPEAQLENVKHDISVPLSLIPEFITRGAAALARAFPGIVIYAFGHAGDGNLHYNVGFADPAANAALMRRRAEVSAVVYEVVDALGGSISAEHGLGQLKRDEIRKHKSALELELMGRLKQALDPDGLMNPGKVL
ncbi:MAG TPA: FAD-binding oxidoreductase [Burkholderiales bacterium]|nr:FAD-binding oxidoreductase [Burkholderiales bacterium]